MNDLISRSALIEEYEWLKSQVNSSSVPEIEEHIERIKKASAVDAVPVVRCGECERRAKSADLTFTVYCPWFGQQMDKTDYCSYGERRNGDG